MDKLLLDILPVYKGWKRHVNFLAVEKHSEPFSLRDAVACDRCGDKGMHCGNEEVARFLVSKDNVVHSIAIEEYLMSYAKHYRRVQGCKCDYLHYDNNKKCFALNELTCSEEKYVNPYDNSKGHQDGKRIHAEKQMANVVDLLLEIPDMVSFIKEFKEKRAIFSWRIPDRNSNVADKAMNVFMLPQRLVANITILSPMNNGFQFTQQIYPSEYRFG